MEINECRKIIEKEEARSVASKALQRVADIVEQFNEVWNEITTAGLPSCWEPNAPAVLMHPDKYTALLEAERDRSDLQMGRGTQLKATTIVTALQKEFSLLHMIRYRLPTHADIHTFGEAFTRVERLSEMSEPNPESQRRLTQFLTQHASPSTDVPPPASTTASTQQLS